MLIMSLTHNTKAHLKHILKYKFTTDWVLILHGPAIIHCHKADFMAPCTSEGWKISQLNPTCLHSY